MSTWNNDCWKTPNNVNQPILHLARETFNCRQICLDPCTAIDNPTKAQYFFTESDNFLKQSPSMIYENCWMNPPFSKPAPFLEKMVDWYKSGYVIQAIALLKTGVLHNQSTSRIVEQSSGICFWRSPRIAFIDANGKPKKKADFDCVLIYYGKDVVRFCNAFSRYGIIRCV
jgi:hypothetical protein